MKVLRRYRFPRNKPPCECEVQYSLDGGATWITEKKYHRFVANYFKVEDYDGH